VWDYDLPAAPNLVDLTVDGQRIPAVAQVTKQGFTFVFHRVTGAPLWPIEERPVPASDIPGESLAATQPHPTRPLPFEAQGVTEGDLIDFTPELRAEALEIARSFRLGPLFTPPSLAGEGAGATQATLQRPGLGGGANWQGAAVDPETGWLYVPSRSSLTAVQFYTPDPKEGGTLRYTHRSAGGTNGPRDLPLVKPPYSRLTAIDLNTGEHAWMQALGDGGPVRQHPDLQHLDLPPLGGDRYTGPLVTKTLLIHGQAELGADEGPPGWLVARSKETGVEVGRVALPGIPIGTPMTYSSGGQQYVALTVSGRPPRLVALALPMSEEP
jgi:quinoprotein glucose dehydrogenase